MAEGKAINNSQGPERKGLKRGDMLPDVALHSKDGHQVRLSNYRGRMNLVLILAGQADDEKVLRLLDEVAGRYAEFAGEEAEVIVVLSEDGVPRAQLAEGRKNPPYVVLADAEGEAHRFFDALDLSGTASPAVVVADRYGEIYAELHLHGSEEMPKIDEILQWLSFINRQCPECGVPEWPQ